MNEKPVPCSRAALSCSKTTVSKAAAKMREEGITPERLAQMSEREVSALFADGRGKRGDQWLEPDYASIRRELSSVPKMTMLLQWMRYCDCNPRGKRLYGYIYDLAGVADPVDLYRLGRLVLDPHADVADPVFLAVVVGKGSLAYTRPDGVHVIPMAALGA